MKPCWWLFKTYFICLNFPSSGVTINLEFNKGPTWLKYRMEKNWNVLFYFVVMHTDTGSLNFQQYRSFFSCVIR